MQIGELTQDFFNTLVRFFNTLVRFLRQTAQVLSNRSASEGQARHERLNYLKTHIKIKISFSFM
jgi:hypothetical protein